VEQQPHAAAAAAAAPHAAATTGEPLAVVYHTPPYGEPLAVGHEHKPQTAEQLAVAAWLGGAALSALNSARACFVSGNRGGRRSSAPSALDGISDLSSDTGSPSKESRPLHPASFRRGESLEDCLKHIHVRKSTHVLC
jgi:hypothetical protein